VTRSFRPRPGRARPRGGRFTWRHGVAALGLAALVLGAGGPARAGQADESALDEAVAAFWAATSDDEVAAATAAILATDPDIEAIWARLRAGRSYAADVPTGRRLLTRRNRDGLEHGYVVRVPERYDPAIRYPVIVYLHGGVARPKREDGTWWRREERLARDDAIVVAPASWNESLWWQDSQIENLAGVLDDLKRTWNLDENRAYLIGISDGATGAFYHAMKATTPWAAFLALNGHPVVLANPASDVDGEMHVTNLRNKPLFVINGGRDRLYPTASVVPFMRLFQQAGVFLDFRPQPDAGHDVSWWDDEKPAMDAFMTDQVRRPLPARLSWETERTDRYNRAHWLVITELGSVEGESDFDDFNEIASSPPSVPIGFNQLGLLEGGGIVLIDIVAGSIAEAAGVRAGDVLVGVNGRAVATVDDLREAVQAPRDGPGLDVEVEREGERLAFVLTPPDDVPAGPARTAFPRPDPAGRVQLARNGNEILVATRGVRRYTLLLSPEQFDFLQPVRVTTNDVLSFEGVVAPDPAVLLRWAARDRDRTMLFGAELDIEVRAP
jgi:predicted esterase